MRLDPLDVVSGVLSRTMCGRRNALRPYRGGTRPFVLLIKLEKTRGMYEAQPQRIGVISGIFHLITSLALRNLMSLCFHTAGDPPRSGDKKETAEGARSKETTTFGRG